MAQGIDHEHLDISRRLFGCGWDFGAVCVVRKKPAAVFFENKAVCHHAPMRQFHWDNVNAANLEGTTDRVGVWPNII